MINPFGRICRELDIVLGINNPLVPGDVWIDKTRNPFQRTKIKIIDYKEKYVLYEFVEIDGRDIRYSDRYSMTEGLLRSKYKLEKKENE